MTIARPIASPIARPVASAVSASIDAGGAAAPISTTCLTFETSSDYVDFGDQSYYSFDGVTDDAFSVSVFVYFDNLTGVAGVVGKWTSAAREWIFYRSGSTFYFELYGPASAVIRATTTVAATTWYHIAATYDGSEADSGITLYVDSVDVGSRSTTSTYTGQVNGAAPLTLGSYNSSNFLAGRLYDLRIYGRELSSTEVSFLDSGSGSNPGTPDVLGVYLNEGTGTTVEDRSPNGNDGTMFNFGANAWVNEFTG